MDYFERMAERKSTCINAQYELKGIQAECEILDISSTGLQLRVKGLLYSGDKINIIIEKQKYPSTVMNANGNIIGIKFENLSDSQLNYLLKLV